MDFMKIFMILKVYDVFTFWWSTHNWCDFFFIYNIWIFFNKCVLICVTFDNPSILIRGLCIRNIVKKELNS
jgi:hypothetical protein